MEQNKNPDYTGPNRIKDTKSHQQRNRTENQSSSGDAQMPTVCKRRCGAHDITLPRKRLPTYTPTVNRKDSHSNSAERDRIRIVKRFAGQRHDKHHSSEEDVKWRKIPKR